LLENTIVGIGALVDRRFVWANARMAEIFGYEPGELAGESVRRFYVTEEDYDSVGQAYAQLAHNSFYTHEHAQVRKNGSIIWCRISGRIVDVGGQNSMSIWVVQDLTDKRRAEDQLRRMNHQLEQTVARRTLNLRRSNQALRAEVERRHRAQLVSTEAREKYRALFGHLPLGVMVTNATGEIIEVNRTMQLALGVATRAAIGPVLADATRVVKADAQRTSLAGIARDQQFRTPRQTRRFAFRWVAGDSSLRDIAAVVVPLSTKGLGAVFTFSDVTEHRLSREREHQQQDELARASRLSLMGQMASVLAHELGQPLNVCQSYLMGIRQRLGEELPDNGSIHSALDKAMAHLVQAGEIIRNVRSFVSRQEPEYRAMLLTELVAQTLQLLEVPLRNARVTVRVETAADAKSRAVRCHPVEIEQVLVNLIINAIDALEANDPSDRWIEIALETAPRAMMLVRVSDNGPGVPTELAAQMFEPYVTTKPAGLGMGLTICRTIIENHAGKLSMTRPRTGGASFSFTLCMADTA
jgi:PAS domain S-box-containing protein